MTDPVKRGYVIDLAAPRLGSRRSSGTRAPVPDDLEALADLMLEAYRGTIDYDDETIVEARDEVAGYFAGDPLLDHSRVRFEGAAAVSAVLLATWRGDPIVSYVMTRREYKRQGLAKALLLDALASLRAAGAERVHLFITDGNVASERLFATLGATEMSDGV